VKRFATGLPQAFATILLGISAQVQWSWAIWMVLDLHNLKKNKKHIFSDTNMHILLNQESTKKEKYGRI
jgi:hypothetical protein